MRNLLRTDFLRMLKSKSFVVALIGMPVFVYAIVLLNNTSGSAEPGIITGNLLTSVSVLLLPAFVCGAIMLYVSAEFAGGAVRNKLIIGHRRTNVYFSWNLIGVTEGLIFIAASLGSVSLLIGLFGDTTGLVAANVLAVAVIVICLMISKIMQSILITIIFPGAKGLMINYLLTYALLIIFMVAAESFPDNKALSLLARCFPEGQVSTLNVEAMPDRPWLTVLCALGMGVLCAILGARVFRKRDIS